MEFILLCRDFWGENNGVFILIVILKSRQKIDKTNAARIEDTGKTYMHKKSNRNTHRHKHR